MNYYLFNYWQVFDAEVCAEFVFRDDKYTNLSDYYFCAVDSQNDTCKGDTGATIMKPHNNHYYAVSFKKNSKKKLFLNKILTN